MLVLVEVPGYTDPNAETSAGGFDSPRIAANGRDDLSSRLFSSGTSPMGGPCGEPQGSPVLSRSVNPHGSAHPFDSGQRIDTVNQEIAAMTTAIATVDFHGTPLSVTTHEGQQLVAMRPICEAIGLAWHGQWERIQRDEVLSTSVRVIRTQLPGDSQHRDVAFLPLDYLNGWLFGIDIKRTKPEIRNSLIQYKRECYAALNAYWNEGAAINPRAFKVNPGDTLTSDEQETLRKLLQDAAARLPKDKQAGFMIQGWSKLKAHFKVPYRQIPRDEFAVAVNVVSRHTAEWEVVHEPIIDEAAIDRASEAAANAAKYVARAVFDAALRGDTDWKDERWLFSMGLDGHGNQDRPYARNIDRQAMVVRLSDLPGFIAAPDFIASRRDLAALAAACNNRLADQLAG